MVAPILRAMAVLAAASFILAFLFSCSGRTAPDPVGPPEDIASVDTVTAPRKGAIRLTPASGLAAKMVAAGEDSASASQVQLGTIWKSKRFYFLLQNVGDTAITDLSITVDIPGVSVSPSRIQVLELPGDAGVVPILEVGIPHGTPLDKIADEPPLWDGLEGDGAVSVTLSFRWDADGDTATPERDSAVYVLGMQVMTAAIRMQTVPDGRHVVTVLGNCPLVLTDPEGIPEVTLQPGQSDTTSLPAAEFASGYPCVAGCGVSPSGWGGLVFANKVGCGD